MLEHGNMVAHFLLNLHPDIDLSLYETSVLLCITHQKRLDSSALYTYERQRPMSLTFCKNLSLNGSLQEVLLQSFSPVTVTTPKNGHVP